MVLLIDEFSKFLNCKPSKLRERLFHPKDRELILEKFKGKLVRTTYKDRNEFNKTFKIGGLSEFGADKINAYGRLPRPFNISVTAHFYSRHRIRLHHPYTHCVIEKFSDKKNGAEDRYYPLELLELIDESTTNPFNTFMRDDNKENIDVKIELNDSVEEKDDNEFEKYARVRKECNQLSFDTYW
uniref:PAZ domain-containing protein n=1 Tax=Meloidogyne enterolobii TaxID=390850 RepID=A0A6V7WW02_MELEN|nr:unnamed protein product [Meloidogyne enterolobii]